MKPFPKIPNAELYLCGGCVRDTLLGKEPKDRDFVVLTTQTFDELTKTIEGLPNAKVFLAKPEFYTIRCLIDGEPIDIAFPRAEDTYTDNRHPDNVKRVNSLLEDARRRDFTINSMYMSENGDVIDYFDGATDLMNRRIRAVEDPNERFKEDALRILRAIRFSIVLKFDIACNTHSAIIDHKESLSVISTERIREELNKCLLSNPESTFKLLKEYRLFELLESKGLTFETTMKER